MAWKVHIHTVAGNFHDAATNLNGRGWAQFLVQMKLVGNHTQCVLRMPTALVYSLRYRDPSFVADVHYDDPSQWWHDTN